MSSDAALKVRIAELEARIADLETQIDAKLALVCVADAASRTGGACATAGTFKTIESKGKVEDGEAL